MFVRQTTKLKGSEWSDLNLTSSIASPFYHVLIEGSEEGVPSPHTLHLALWLLCLILKRDSCSACESHPCPTPLLQVLRFLFRVPASGGGASVLMAPYQPLTEDSWTKLLSSVFNRFIQRWAPPNSIKISLSTLPLSIVLADNIHLRVFLFNNNPQAELRSLFSYQQSDGPLLPKKKKIIHTGYFLKAVFGYLITCFFVL